MAKRKTPKVKDLRPKNISKEQLQGLQGLVQQLNAIQVEIGRLETRKHTLNHDFSRLQESLQEENIALRKEYGEVNINIQDGAITYPEDEQVNKKD